jgi:hypothetical protein
MDRFYQSLPALAGFAVSVAPALKPTHEARRRGGDSIARRISAYDTYRLLYSKSIMYYLSNHSRSTTPNNYVNNSLLNHFSGRTSCLNLNNQ